MGMAKPRSINVVDARDVRFNRSNYMRGADDAPHELGRSEEFTAYPCEKRCQLPARNLHLKLHRSCYSGFVGDPYATQAFDTPIDQRRSVMSQTKKQSTTAVDRPENAPQPSKRETEHVEPKPADPNKVETPPN